MRVLIVVLFMMLISYGSESKVECSICMESIDKLNTREYYQTTCFHPFHRPCLSDWFQKGKNCPLCRKNLQKDFEAFLCEPGYTYIPQHLLHEQARQQITPATCPECATACDMDYDCTSYECSPDQQICYLHDQYAPTKQKRGHPKINGFHLCQRKESERTMKTLIESQQNVGKSLSSAILKVIPHMLLYELNELYHFEIHQPLKKIISYVKYITFDFKDIALWLVYGCSMLLLWCSEVPKSAPLIESGIYVEILSISLTIHLILQHLGRFNIWFVNIIEGFIFAWIQRWLYDGSGFYKHSISVHRQDEAGRELTKERSPSASLFMSSFWKMQPKQEIILALSTVLIAYQLANYINNTYPAVGMHYYRKKLINQRVNRTWLIVQFFFGTMVGAGFEIVLTANGWLGMIINRSPPDLWIIFLAGLKLQSNRFSNLFWEVLFGRWWFQYDAKMSNLSSSSYIRMILGYLILSYLSKFNLSMAPVLLICFMLAYSYVFSIKDPGYFDTY